MPEQFKPGKPFRIRKQDAKPSPHNMLCQIQLNPAPIVSPSRDIGTFDKRAINVDCVSNGAWRKVTGGVDECTRVHIGTGEVLGLSLRNEDSCVRVLSAFY